MIVIGLTQQVANDIALAALPQASLSNQQIVWNLGEAMAYVYYANATSGDVAPDDQAGGKGFWRKDPTLEGLDLQGYKDYKNRQIDEKTGELISTGFTWDSLIFSMSSNAQINWSNIPNVPDSLFPLPVMTKDDKTVYNLALSNKMNFYLTALNFKNGYLQSGTSLKNQVEACTTDAEVEAIHDNR